MFSLPFFFQMAAPNVVVPVEDFEKAVSIDASKLNEYLYKVILRDRSTHCP